MLGLYTWRNMVNVNNAIADLAVYRVAHPTYDEGYVIEYHTQRGSLNNKERRLFDKVTDNTLWSPSGMDDIIKAFKDEIYMEQPSYTP